MTASTVSYTGEFHRVASLPRRVWSEPELTFLIQELTSLLRAPAALPCPVKPCDTAGAEARERDGLCPRCASPLVLRAVQAQALHDAGTEGGLFGSIGVGEGKTLLMLLLPLVLFLERPVLLVPGGLLEKTARDRIDLSWHWRIPTSLRVLSYDWLGRVDAADELATYKPDGIICDEVHRLKNKRAAVTRRVARYMHEEPTTKFAGASGTVVDKSLREFAHLLLWALKWKAPVPTRPEEIDEWADAVDVGIDPWSRRRAGALLEFCKPEDRAGVTEEVAARRGFRRRLIETPGVVATVGDGEHIDASIYVRAIRHKVAPVTEKNFRILRVDWQTPDGWELMLGTEVYQHAQELALGLHYAWDPRPPVDWLTARSAWGHYMREIIARSRTFDSELHVKQAVDAGHVPNLAVGRAVLSRWRELEPTFTPNVVPVWHDDSAIEACVDWIKKQGKAGGIIWTEHRFFAERLAARAGARYFGAGGFCPDGAYIEDCSPGEFVIASIDANREGKNLQRIWSRNLLVCPPASAAWMEQVIARTHRPGQPADEVTVEILIGCRENYDNICKALEAARAVQDLTGKRQKLLLASLDMPAEREIDALGPYRWVK